MGVGDQGQENNVDIKDRQHLRRRHGLCQRSFALHSILLGSGSGHACAPHCMPLLELQKLRVQLLIAKCAFTVIAMGRRMVVCLWALQWQRPVYRSMSAGW